MDLYGEFSLKRAAEQYGIENFQIEIIVFGIKTIEELNALEIRYLAEYKTFIDYGHGYNLTHGGNSKETSQETRQKLSIAHSGKNHRNFG